MTDINDLGLSTYAVRPLVPSDAHRVFDLMAAEEHAAIGEVAIEQADIVADWQRPSFELARQSIGVLERQGDRLVGYAEVFKGRWADAAVDLEHHGRGIGTALALWTQRVSRRDGAGLVGMPVPAGSGRERLLRDLGYTPAWTSWVLELPEGARIEPQPLPPGYTVRAAVGETEHRAAHAVIDAAFLEWSDRDPEPFEDFAAEVMGRPTYAPWNIRVVTDPHGTIVASAVVFCHESEQCGYVAKLATRRDQRGRGLARALLVDSFHVAREHGGTRSELSTDSRTGALSLYEKVGMQVTSTWVHLAIQT